jgi:hypothetical protein
MSLPPAQKLNHVTVSIWDNMTLENLVGQLQQFTTQNLYVINGERLHFGKPDGTGAMGNLKVGNVQEFPTHIEKYARNKEDDLICEFQAKPSHTTRISGTGRPEPPKNTLDKSIQDKIDQKKPLYDEVTDSDDASDAVSDDLSDISSDDEAFETLVFPKPKSSGLMIETHDLRIG